MEFSTQIILVNCALFVLKVLTLSVSGPTSDHAHQTKSSNEFSELDSHAQREHNDVLEASKTLFMMANDHRGNTHDTIKNIKKYHYNKPPKQTKEEQRKNQREYRRAKRAAMSLEQRRASYRKDHEDRKRKRAKSSEVEKRYRAQVNASTRRWKARKDAKEQGKEISPENALRRPSKKVQATKPMI